MSHSSQKSENYPTPLPLIPSRKGRGDREECNIPPPLMRGGYERFMDMALKEASMAAQKGDVPVGAVAVIGDEVIARGHNMREALNDPTAHAEMLVIRESARKLGRWRLSDVTLYVTIEPCAMCAGAIVLSRIPRVVFGAKDPKGGGCGSVFQILQEPLLNHRVEIVTGIKEAECRRVLEEFFENRRMMGKQALQ